MEILNELERMAMSLDCLNYNFEEIDYDNETDLDSILNLFSDVINQNEILGNLMRYNRTEKNALLKLAISSLIEVNDAYHSIKDINHEDKYRIANLANMATMMSKTYLYLLKRILSGSWE